MGYGELEEAFEKRDVFQEKQCGSGHKEETEGRRLEIGRPIIQEW